MSGFAEGADEATLYGERKPSLRAFRGTHVVEVTSTRGGVSQEGRKYFAFDVKVIASSNSDLAPGVELSASIARNTCKGADSYFFGDIKKFIAAASGSEPVEVTAAVIDACVDDPLTLEGNILAIQVWRQVKAKKGERVEYTETRYLPAGLDTDPAALPVIGGSTTSAPAVDASQVKTGF